MKCVPCICIIIIFREREENNNSLEMNCKRDSILTISSCVTYFFLNIMQPNVKQAQGLWDTNVVYQEKKEIIN